MRACKCHTRGVLVAGSSEKNPGWLTSRRFLLLRRPSPTCMDALALSEDRAVPCLLEELRCRPHLVATAVRQPNGSGSSAWWARIATLVRSNQQEPCLAGAALLRASVLHADHSTFRQQREPWTNMLLPLLQSSGEPEVRLAAAGTLLQLLASSAPWPLERRELASCAPRVLTTVLTLITADDGPALRLLLQLAREAPHALRQHHLRLNEVLPAMVMGPSPSASRAAAAMLGLLPSCMSTGYPELWLRTVQGLAGSLQELLVPLLGSLTTRRALLYQLKGYALPASLHASRATERPLNLRCSELLSAVSGCVAALHYCCSPPVAPPSGAVAPLPVHMLCDLAFFILSEDGALPLPAPSAGSLPRGWLLVLLPELHRLALQLLLSVVAAAGRHALSQCASIVNVLNLCWRRSGPAGSLSMRCRKLRLATYTTASTLLHVFGASAAVACAEPLIAAACADLAADAAVPPPPVLSEQLQPHKRQRDADANSHAAAFSPPAPRVDDAIQLAAARALAALLHAGGALLPLRQVATVEAMVLRVAASGRALPAVLRAEVVGLAHALVASGQQVRAETLPCVLSLLHDVGACLAPLPHASAAARRGLHAIDTLLHPLGVQRWVQSPLLSMPVPTNGTAFAPSAPPMLPFHAPAPCASSTAFAASASFASSAAPSCAAAYAPASAFTPTPVALPAGSQAPELAAAAAPGPLANSGASAPALRAAPMAAPAAADVCSEARTLLHAPFGGGRGDDDENEDEEEDRDDSDPEIVLEGPDTCL